jgi:hypothetical protein
VLESITRRSSGSIAAEIPNPRRKARALNFGAAESAAAMRDARAASLPLSAWILPDLNCENVSPGQKVSVSPHRANESAT